MTETHEARSGVTQSGDRQPMDMLNRRENVAFADVWQSASMVFQRHNIRLILTCVAVTVGIGLLYLLLAPANYRAQAQLLIETRLPQFLRDSSDTSYGLDSSQIESHIVVLQSERIANAVIANLSLLDDPDFGAPKSADQAVRGRTATEHFQRRLQVARVGISYVIAVSFFSSNPEKAARIANATVDAYLQSLIDSRSEAARVASDWLEDRLARLRVQMNDAERRAQQFRVTQDYRIATRTKRPNEATGNETEKKGAAPDEPSTLEELELTVETYRKVYQNFFSAFTEAVQRESYPVSNVRVVSRATAPDRRSSPKGLLVLGVALFAGLLIGLALALVREHRGGNWPAARWG